MSEPFCVGPLGPRTVTSRPARRARTTSPRLSSPGPGNRLRLERRLLAKDRGVELLERGCRLDSELVDERASRFLIGLERFRLPTRSVEGEHQLPAGTLPERVLPHECFELTDEIPAAAELELGLDPLLELQSAVAPLGGPPRSARRRRMRSRRAAGRAIAGAPHAGGRRGVPPPLSLASRRSRSNRCASIASLSTRSA